MRIRKFNEDEQVDISSERVDEIIKDLKDLSSIIDNKSKMIEGLLNELGNYKNQSKKGNDQIDDSIAALQVIKGDIGNCSDKIDTVVNNLVDYNTEGRKYLYTENK